MEKFIQHYTNLKYPTTVLIGGIYLVRVESPEDWARRVHELMKVPEPEEELLPEEPIPPTTKKTGGRRVRNNNP